MLTLSLSGCSPTPLTHYFKTLGILRLASNRASTPSSSAPT